MSTALASVPSLSLYALSEELQCLVDTAEMVDEGTIEREDLDEAIARFQEALPAKVDDTGRALAWLENLAALAGQEAKRLQARKQAFERAVERMESYCVKVIEKLPEPKKGRRKLEGSTTTLSIRPSERTLITDEEAIPVGYKTACVEMPAQDWEMVVDLYPQVLEALTKQDLKVRVADVKADLKKGILIAGADLEFPNNLRRS